MIETIKQLLRRAEDPYITLLEYRNTPVPDIGLNLVPRAFSSFKMAGRRNPWPRLPMWLQKFVRISSRKRNLSLFRFNHVFRLQKTNRTTIRWKQPPGKPFHPVSRDKILHDPWSISAALARGFSDPPF